MKLPNEVVRPSTNQNVAHKHKRQTTLLNYPAGRNENLRQYDSSISFILQPFNQSSNHFHQNQNLQLDNKVNWNIMVKFTAIQASLPRYKLATIAKTLDLSHIFKVCPRET